jgi:hypothetical protein
MSNGYVASGPEFLVNSETDSDQVLSTISGLADGGFVVTWIGDAFADELKEGLKNLRPWA